MRAILPTLIAASFLLTLAASPATAQEPCRPTSERLCLNEGRFQVEVDWRDFEGQTGRGQAVLFNSDDSGLFWFFSVENWEMQVKVLNGCALNDRFWVFSAATTNVEYTLAVTDTLTGESKSYKNPLGRRADAITDTDAFATCRPEDATAAAAPTAPAELPHKGLPVEQAGPCTRGPSNFCFNDDRFRVEVAWRDFAGNTGSGTTVGISSDDSGLFWFFSPDNWEMLVKVLDGCALNDRFWVFSAATTNVEYTLEVTDTLTGLRQRYFNPLGTSAPAITDTDAFATCDAAAVSRPVVRFLSDRSVILTGAQPEALLEVEVVDGEGRPVPGAEVVWSSAESELVSVSRESPTSARVAALGQPPGYAAITARFGDAEARAMVLLAEPGPSTVLVDSRRVLERGRREVVLERTSETEALAPGQILVSGDSAGLLDRIVSAAVEGSTVRLQVTPASLAEAFEELEVEVEGDPFEIKLRMAKEGSSVELYDPAGELVSKALIDRIQCKTESGTTAGVQVRGGSVDLRYRLTPDASLKTSFFSLQLFRIRLRGEVSLSGSTGSVHFGTDIGGKVRCSVELGQFTTPGLPVSVFSIGLNFTVVVGVEASAQFSGPSLTITGPHGSATGRASAGLEYTPGGGWRTLRSRSWNGELVPLAVDLDLDVEFEASAGPFGQLDVGLVVDLGRGFFSINLADFRFAELVGSGAIELAMRSPLDPRQPAYKGPEWGLGLKLEGNLKAELAGGVLADLLDYVGIDTNFAGPLNLFTLEVPLASSPAPETTTVSTPRGSCAAGLPELRVGETATFRTRDPDADAGVRGTAGFWGSLGGSPPLATLTSGRFGNRSGEAAWTPGAPPGIYRVYPRLAVDAISRLLPYGGGPSVFGELIVVAEGDGVPVIEEVLPERLVLTDGGLGEVRVRFSDSDGGINRVSFEVVELDCPVGCNVSSTSFPAELELFTEGSFIFTNSCVNPTPFVNTAFLALTLSDCQGNTSEPADFVFECRPGEGGEGLGTPGQMLFAVARD